MNQSKSSFENMTSPDWDILPPDDVNNRQIVVYVGVVLAVMVAVTCLCLCLRDLKQRSLEAELAGELARRDVIRRAMKEKLDQLERQDDSTSYMEHLESKTTYVTFGEVTSIEPVPSLESLHHRIGSHIHLPHLHLPHLPHHHSYHHIKEDSDGESDSNDGTSGHDTQSERGHGSHGNKGHGNHGNKGHGNHGSKGHGNHGNKGHGNHGNKGHGNHGNNRIHGNHGNRGHGRTQDTQGKRKLIHGDHHHRLGATADSSSWFSFAKKYMFKRKTSSSSQESDSGSEISNKDMWL